MGKRAQTTGNGRRQRKPKAAQFDIQVRNYNYKAVPDPSVQQMRKTFVVSKKAQMDKMQAQRDHAGCKTFKYRNNYAFSQEKEMLNRGVTVRDGTIPGHNMNYSMMSQPISMSSHMESSHFAGSMQETRQSQVERLLVGDY